MFREVSSSTSSRAENEDELGESSSLSGGSDDEAAADSPQNKSYGDPLHGLSSLVSQLPIKRGLSKFYQGKSQSFSSFSDVRTAEDLAKKNSPIIKGKLKPSRSYAEGLGDYENHKSHYGPDSGGDNNNKGMMPKKGPRGSCASSIARTSSGSSCFASGKPPSIPTHKNVYVIVTVACRLNRFLKYKDKNRGGCRKCESRSCLSSSSEQRID